MVNQISTNQTTATNIDSRTQITPSVPEGYIPQTTPEKSVAAALLHLKLYQLYLRDAISNGIDVKQINLLVEKETGETKKAFENTLTSIGAQPSGFFYNKLKLAGTGLKYLAGLTLLASACGASALACGVGGYFAFQELMKRSIDLKIQLPLNSISFSRIS